MDRKTVTSQRPGGESHSAGINTETMELLKYYVTIIIIILYYYSDVNSDNFQESFLTEAE